MFRQHMKTLVYTITVLFIAAPLALAAEPISGKGAKTLQDVGAVQGQDKIVTFGPKPADPARDTNIQPDVKTGPTTLQDVGAVQGQDEIVTHGPVPSSTR